MSDSAAFLSIMNLRKRYGAHVAVDGVTLEIAKSELVTLLGPSGSGKTTLLMSIAGFAKPDRGRIVLEGRDITALPPHLRGIGVVFQQYALFPHLNVAENVAYPLTVRRVPKAKREAAVHEVLRLVHLDTFKSRYPQQLSGGQQQRVALARALVFRPPVLLMDEPLGALDRKLRAEMQLEIRRIQNLLGITTVYVTHDQEEALTISDRVAIVHEGRIEQIGSPSDVYRRPRSAFVAEFVGDSNLFIGQVDFCDPGGTHLNAAGLRFPVDVPEDSRIGPACIAMVRPESVVVSREPTPLCVHRGIVTQIVYLGSVLRIQIKAAGSLVAAAINPSLTSEIPSEGEEVCFGWQKQNAVLLPAGVNPGRPQCEQEFEAR